MDSTTKSKPSVRRALDARDNWVTLLQNIRWNHHEVAGNLGREGIGVDSQKIGSLEFCIKQSSKKENRKISKSQRIETYSKQLFHRELKEDEL